MSQDVIRCPNCGAANPSDRRQCAICDAALVEHRERRQRVTRIQRPVYDYASHEGEDDLLVRRAVSTPLGIVAGVILLVIIVAAAVAAFLTFGPTDDGGQDAIFSENLTPSVTSTVSATPFPTNTRPAPLIFPTVTPMPSPPTPTPEPTPCIKTAGSGDTIYGLASACGHRHFSIVDVVVEVNPELDCSSCLREGQTIEIPWPTPESDGEAEDAGAAVLPSETDAAEGEGDAVVAVAANEFGTPDALATLFVEPTLRPGLMWHYVQEGETLISIVSTYNADAKVLSDINPELDFGQCDFGARFGGPDCNVLLVQGQRLRVPAPTPTPTLSLTPSGSETPTPTATPTVNIPTAFSPRDGSYFDANSLVTLRWSATGSLAMNENYLVAVTDLDTGLVYQARTQELYYVLPDAWQPTNGRTQTFEWTVSIATVNGTQILSIRETTIAREFTWQGQE